VPAVPVLGRPTTGAEEVPVTEMPVPAVTLVTEPELGDTQERLPEVSEESTWPLEVATALGKVKV